jgi:hypothetical protein
VLWAELRAEEERVARLEEEAERALARAVQDPPAFQDCTGSIWGIRAEEAAENLRAAFLGRWAFPVLPPNREVR